jgi:hypothetical protein
MQIARFVLNGQLTMTPWFPRQADNAIFGYQILKELFPTDTIGVTVYHKNREDSGRGELHSSPSWDADGNVRTAAFEGLKEMVRFSIAGGGAIGVVFRMLPPTWYDDAN